MSSARISIELTCSALGIAHVVSGDVDEAIGRPTRATLQLLADTDLSLEDALDQEATLVFKVEQRVVRTWHLLVTSASFEGVSGPARTYSLVLDNALARLKLRSDVRMFQEMDAKDIVSEVLKTAGIPASSVSWNVIRSLTKRTYCVQHRETDWDFVQRLLEHEGIFTVIDDESSPWKVIFADTKDAFVAIDDESTVPLSGGENDTGVEALEIAHSSISDEISLRDWNYETPPVDLTQTQKLSGSPLATLYEYPGGYATPAEAAAFARIRGEELVSGRVTGTGRSDWPQFRAGAWFVLASARRADLATKYLLRRVRHVFGAVTQKARQGERKGPRYRNTFTCSPLDQPFRPARITPKPVIHGSQSVLVKGPSGEEIYTDKLGRMKGKFYWDRLGTDDANASCWMRVAQLPIGGSMALARVGWEMDVRFAFGDPDRPVAIARVDNGNHKAPYAYPAAASAMSFKTMSSPGGGKFNEFTMEDGGGSMKFGVTASKDWSEVVVNNKCETIAVDEKLEIGVDSATTVKSNQKVTVSATHTKSVGANAKVAITGARTKTVGAAETVTITGSLEEKITGSDSETVGATRMSVAGLGISRTSMGSCTLTVGSAMVSAAGKECAISVAGSRAESIGAAKLVLAGKAIEEKITGAGAITIGGVCLNVAGGNRTGAAKGKAAITVGGVVLANAGGKMQLKGKKIKIVVAGVANLLGGGGILNLTPGSASFVGLVTVKASGAVKITGAPNLVG